MGPSRPNGPAGYRELGADYYDRLQPERLTHRLVHRPELLGHEVTLEDRPAEEHAEHPGYLSEQCSSRRANRWK